MRLNNACLKPFKIFCKTRGTSNHNQENQTALPNSWGELWLVVWHRLACCGVCVFFISSARTHYSLKNLTNHVVVVVVIPIQTQQRRVRLSQEDWSRFVLFDKEGTYTRNLVLTDNQHYTLLALCWNPGCESPIHDHPCDGCWMKVCEGSIQESRYERRSNKNNNNGKDLLVCTTAETYQGENNNDLLTLFGGIVQHSLSFSISNSISLSFSFFLN